MWKQYKTVDGQLIRPQVFKNYEKLQIIAVQIQL